jgi:transposase
LEKHSKEILALVAKRPDMTLDEIVAELRKWGVRTSDSSVSRFFQRHDITFKKKPAGGRTAARGRRPGAQTLDKRARAAGSGPTGVHR